MVTTPDKIPTTMRVTIPRTQDGVTFSDESWKQFCDRLEAKGQLIECHEESVTYDYPVEIAVSLVEQDSVRRGGK